ncbi:MAG: Hsp20 family protein [Pseudomonadota bacterium]|nr:Hsp20 family protein [Pseudomonadota bacterium]
MANVLAFTPLMRSTIGFDRFNDLFESLTDGTEDRFDTYPPYNIEKAGEDQYRIVMAVAGFTMNDLNITAQRDTLVVTGKSEDKAENNVAYLHRGIAARAFQRSFRLADHIKVVGADMRDGLLTIHLVHEVPEEAKPRMIQINGGTGSPTIEAKNKQKAN